ncbi:MAG: glycosyltransferase family 4 protein [Candidatus Aminicenantes bacterium]|nr:glycosyltransferase family 4 protein [Candidatus Aminicenantes bacterium]
MNIHQFSTSLTYGDAISDEMLEIQKVLRDQGHQSEIFTRFFDPRLAGLRRDYREYRKLSAAANVVIFHFSIGSPVSKLFFRLPDRKIMIYHNITPHVHFVDWHRILARECYKGRLELRLFVDKVDLAVGDSEFNRRELEAAGYPRTGVLPILMDFSKFDGPGDPVTKRLFGDGKTTVLFVGRVIPNKKFEDVIKTFRLYQKYFNSDSRLVLAGDYRGLERYHASLLALVDRLAVKDVHFTGHVDFGELLAYFDLADVYLSLSEHEGFGVPILEAFSKRIPVIGFDAGAVAETMNGGGVLVRDKDFFKIAALIDVLVRDRGLRQAVIRGQLRAGERYSRETVARVLRQHIEEVTRR